MPKECQFIATARIIKICSIEFSSGFVAEYTLSSFDDYMYYGSCMVFTKDAGGIIIIKVSDQCFFKV